MELFENKVGRPSNEILKKRKIFKVGVVVGIVAIILGAFCLGYYGTLKLKGAVSTITISNSPKAGDKVVLSSTPIYSSAYSTKQSNTKSGNYYLNDSSIINNKMRIVKNKSDVGKIAKVIGWIKVAKKPVATNPTKTSPKISLKCNKTTITSGESIICTTLKGAKVSVNGISPVAAKYNPTVNSNGGFTQKLTTVGGYEVIATKSGYSNNKVVITVKSKTANTTSSTNGWKKESGSWYYYKNGKKLTGWQQLKYSKGTGWFYFESNGKMVTGWKKLKWSGGTNWFYFDSDGCMYSNSCKTINKEKFCFDKNGVCYEGRGCVEYKANEKVKLSKTKIYSSSTTSKVKATKSGTYYIYKDASVKNNRVRISEKKNGSSYGWVRIESIKKDIVPQTAKPTSETLKKFTLDCPTQIYVGDKGTCKTNTAGVKITITKANLASGYSESFVTTSDDKVKNLKYTKSGTIKVTATKSGYNTITKTVTIKTKPTQNSTIGSGKYSVTKNQYTILVATVCQEDGTGYTGAKAVIDTIFNRVDSSSFPNTTWKVVTAPKQFAAYSDGHYKRRLNSNGTLKSECNNAKKAVDDAMANPSNRSHKSLYFQATKYKTKGWTSKQIGDNWYRTDSAGTLK